MFRMTEIYLRHFSANRQLSNYWGAGSELINKVLPKIRNGVFNKKSYQSSEKSPSTIELFTFKVSLHKQLVDVLESLSSSLQIREILGVFST
eukprot:gene7563-5335_t